MKFEIKINQLWPFNNNMSTINKKTNIHPDSIVFNYPETFELQGVSPYDTVTWLINSGRGPRIARLTTPVPN